MKSPRFDYAAPGTLAEAIDILGSAPEDSRPIAGGQSLIPLMAFRLADPGLLVDLRYIEELRSWSDDGNAVTVGAMVTQATLATIAAAHPLVREAIPLIAHPQIRNRGTLGGSLAHADPAAELPAVAVALGAEIVAEGREGQRKLPAGSFFTSYFTTALESGQVLTAVRLPGVEPGEGSAILEVSRRPGDFALAGVAVRIRLSDDGGVEDSAVVTFAVGERPVRSDAAAAELVGREPRPDVVLAAADAVSAEADPPADMHAGSAYRRHAVRVLAGRALRIAIDRAGEALGR